MAKRFTEPVVNWANLEKMVPVEQRVKYLAFKAKSDMYLQRRDGQTGKRLLGLDASSWRSGDLQFVEVRANPPEPPKINWDHYKKLVADGSIVDKMKDAYEKFKVPYPEDKVSATIDQQWSALEPTIKAFCEDVQKDIDRAQKQLDRIKSLPKFDDMTMEMFRDIYPEKALDPVNKPSFWPHNPEEQPGYLTPEQKALKKEKKK